MKLIYLLLIIGICSCVSPPSQSAQQVSVNFQLFYDELSPYGTWVNNSEYGYVWMPNVGPGFEPYATNGYWVLTDEGWTWVSNYSWGWAPFHYGRWFTDDMYGPMWIPDNEWGPGWVSWRRSEGYYGWAPMGPGISIYISNGNGYYERHNHYTFLRGSHMGRRDMYNYYENHDDRDRIFNNSTVINKSRHDRRSNVTYNPGPDKADVEKYAVKKILPIKVKESNKADQNISNDQLKIYRPNVQNSLSNDPKPAPKNVENMKNIKPAEKRTIETPKQTPQQPAVPQPVIQQPFQPKQVAPSKKMEDRKQQQQPQIQPPQQNNPPKKMEEVQHPSQPQQIQPPTQAVPSKQMQELKKTEQGNQKQQMNQSKKIKKSNQSQKVNPQPQNNPPKKMEGLNQQQPKQQKSQPQFTPPKNNGVEKQRQQNRQQPKQQPQQKNEPPRQQSPPPQPKQIPMQPQTPPPGNPGGEQNRKK